MKTCSFILVAWFYSFILHGQTCDSIQIVLNSYQQDAQITWQSLEIDTIRDLQIVSTTMDFWDPATQTFIPGQTAFIQWDTIGNQVFRTSGNMRIMYEYDTAGRIAVLDTAGFDGVSWISYSDIAYYFAVSGKDSMELHYGFRNNVFMLTGRIASTYDSSGQLTRKITEGYLNNAWVVTEDIRTVYSSVLPNVVRVDSVYQDYSTGLGLVYVYAYFYNSADSAAYSIYESPFNPMFSDNTYWTSNRCGHTLWELGFGHTGMWERASFDSLCRFIHYEYGGGTLSSGVHNDRKDYSYVNCNNLAGFISASAAKICSGDSVLLATNVFGGLPPYHYQWSAGSGIGDDSVSHTIVFPDSTSMYICTVTDANLHVWTDSLFIHVDPLVPADIYLLSLDTSGACSSAELATTPVRYTSYHWNRDGVSVYNPDSILHAIYNGVYTLQLYSGVCPVQSDTLVLTQLIHPSPMASIAEGCNELIGHANGPVTFEWFLNNDTTSIYTGDTLQFSADANYYLIAKDTSGCASARVGSHYQAFRITPQFVHACNDSCRGTAQVTAWPYYVPYSYQWSNGDTTSFADSLCNGIVRVTVTNLRGCRLTAVDSCSNVSVPEIAWTDGHLIYVFPNPSSGRLTVDLKAARLNFPVRWQVTDLSGRILHEQSVDEPEIQFEKNNLLPGIYLFRIRDEHGVTTTGKFIIE